MNGGRFRERCDLAEVDVVILTWNDGDLLARAVSSALDSTDVNVAVHVVDNGSDPPATVPADPRVLLSRFATNRGTTVSRNVGARDGHAPFLCFLDSDAELSPMSLGRLLEPMVDDDVAMVVPVFVAQKPEASAGLAPTIRVKVERAANRRTTYVPGPGRPVAHGQWDVEFGIGACQLVRRSYFESIGGFDEGYFYAPEDVDLCLRIGDAGGRIVQITDTGVVHDARRAFRKPFSRRSWLHLKGLCRHYWRRSTRTVRSRFSGS